MRSSLSSVALLATVAAAAVTAAPAAAAPAVSDEFDAHGRPGQLTLGPDGNVWAVVTDGDADVIKIAPDGTVTPYRDARLANAIGIVAGPDRNLWVTRSGEVVRFAPNDPTGTDSAVTIATLNDPKRIASDSRSLWTASGDQLYRIDAATSTVTRTRVTGLAARGTAVASDGRILVADFDGGRIASFDPAALDRPSFIDVGGRPQEVAAGPNGSFGYTNPQASPQEIGVVAPPAPLVRTVVDGTDPSGVVYAPDQAYWIANFNSHDLTRLSTTGDVTKLGGFSPLSGPRWVTVGSGGTLWVSLEVARRVARVTGVEAPRVDPPRTDPPRTDPPRSDPPRTGDTTPPLLKLARSGRARAGARAVVVTATIDETSTLTATLRQRVAGKRRGSACVKPTRKLRRARGCVRLVVLGSARASAKGAGSVRLTLRRRDRRALAAGSYRIDVSARDSAGNRTTKTLTVVLRRPRR